MASPTPVRDLLPVNVKPIHYDLELAPDFESFRIPGRVSIDLDVLEDSTEVSLHSQATELVQVSLHRPDDATDLAVKEVRNDEEKNVTTLVLGEVLPAGSKAKLQIEFVSILNEGKVGIFYRKFEVNGEEKLMAASQMQPIDARRAFPCFDEPGLKATFNISLTADEHLTALSNSKVVSREPLSSGKIKTSFATTPPMCTYLTAFVIGELDYIENLDFHIPLRLYTIPGQAERGRYILDMTPKVLEFYENTFECKFPLPKLDHVAIPGHKGAMENWGLITYDASYILVDEHTPISMKQMFTRVFFHEVAHQWFGNIVTMRYWDGLWLNEAFAEWTAWYCCDHFFPEWNPWMNFLTTIFKRGLSADSLMSSHPVEVPVTSANLINQLFDAVTYQKGASIVRMIANSLGQAVFLKGVKAYIRKHSYSSTDTADLWAALSEASGVDVESAMSIWTKKTGYPVLTVAETEGGLAVRQNRFLSSGHASEQDDHTVFPISIALRTNSGSEKSDRLFDSRDIFIPLRDVDFVIVNADRYGFYRTLYSTPLLAKIQKAAQNGLLPTVDRIGLVDDARALVPSGHLRTDLMLDLVDSLAAREGESLVWEMFVDAVRGLNLVWKFQKKEVIASLRKFSRELFGSRARQVGWDFNETDDASLSKHKALMFEVAGIAGEPLVLEAARSLFQEYTSGSRSAVHPILLTPVFYISIYHGGKPELDAAMTLLNDKSLPSADFDAISKVIGATRDTGDLDKVLEYSLSDTFNQKSDFYHPLGCMVSSPISPHLWNWLRNNWDLVYRTVGQGIDILVEIVRQIIVSLGTPEHVREVKEFFFTTAAAGEGGEAEKGQAPKKLVLKKKFEGQSMGIEQGLEELEARVKWVERDHAKIEEWLRNRYGSGYGSEEIS